jgi:phosphoadenosine phosphosulfate reductase
MKGKHPDEVDEDENFIKTERGGYMLLNYDNDESVKTVYTCFRTNKVMVNPIINWKEEDVWKYISAERIPINPLYECGYTRVGCIGCPMGRYKKRVSDFSRYPKYRDRYIRIADKIVEMNHAKGKLLNFKTGLDYFRHWIEDPNIEGQFSFDMDGNITEDYV